MARVVLGLRQTGIRSDSAAPVASGGEVVEEDRYGFSPHQRPLLFRLRAASWGMLTKCRKQMRMVVGYGWKAAARRHGVNGVFAPIVAV